MSESEFERRVASALHAPVRMGARSTIMDRVRALPAHERPVRRLSAVARRTVRHSLVGVALAAGIGSLTTLSSVLPHSHGSGLGNGLATRVIGDTVGATLHDTLRLVRLMFDDAAAHRVAAVGDFNAWRTDSILLRRDSATRRWTATLALRDGAHRYAFVVDGTRWTLDPSAPHVRGDDGRVYSLLHVAATAN